MLKKRRARERQARRASRGASGYAALISRQLPSMCARWQESARHTTCCPCSSSWKPLAGCSQQVGAEIDKGLSKHGVNLVRCKNHS